MHLDHDLRPHSGNRGDRLYQVERSVELVALKLQVAIPKRIELHAAVAALDDRLRRGGELLRRTLHGIPAVRIRRDPVLDLAPKQAVYGLSRRLSDDVPACEFDERQAGVDHFSGLAEVEQSHAPVQRFNVVWVMPDEVALDVFQVLDDRVGLPQHPGFAHAFDALVCFEDEVCEVAPGCAQHERSESCDFHLCLWASGSVGRNSWDAVGAEILS